MILEIYNYGTKKLPTKKNIYDAGYDVYIPDNNNIFLAPHSYTVIDLKFGINIPPGYFGYLCGRSSGAVNGLLVHQAPIDTGYTNNLHCIIFNCSNSYIELSANKAVAQLIILPVTLPTLTENINNYNIRKSKDWNGSTNE